MRLICNSIVFFMIFLFSTSVFSAPVHTIFNYNHYGKLNIAGWSLSGDYTNWVYNGDALSACAGNSINIKIGSDTTNYPAKGGSITYSSDSELTITCNYLVSNIVLYFSITDCETDNSCPVCEGPVSSDNYIALDGVMCDSGAECTVAFDNRYLTTDGYNYTNITNSDPEGISACEFSLDDFNSQVAEEYSCELPYVLDPVLLSCVCADGEICDELPPTPDCDNSDSCLLVAESSCHSSQALMEYQYLGGSSFSSSCGIVDAQCADSWTWNIIDQTCLLDSDGDGISDPYDPAPNDETETGDTDKDGVPDSQDTHPADPTRFNSTGSTLQDTGLITGDLVTPIGESTNFNDTAIVNAINENTKATNTTNQLTDDLKDIGTAGNSINKDGFTDVTTSLSTTNTTLDKIKSFLEDIKDNTTPESGTAVNQDISNLITSTNEDLGIPVLQDSNSTFVDTLFGKISVSRCVNPVFDGNELDLCSNAERVLPLATFTIWVLTLIFMYGELHSVLRRRS
jgi:hypothetical protein